MWVVVGADQSPRVYSKAAASSRYQPRRPHPSGLMQIVKERTFSKAIGLGWIEVTKTCTRRLTR